MQDHDRLGEGTPETSSMRKKVGLLRRVFRPRDILIRSQGRVQFINLSPRLQIGLCAGVSFAAFWLVGITATSFWQSSIIEDRNLAIIEAKLSQERVSSDFEIYKTELERISALLTSPKYTDKLIVSNERDGELNIREEMVSFRILGEKVQDSLTRAALDFDVETDEQDRIVKSRSGLHDKIMRLKVELAKREQKIHQQVSVLSGVNEKLTHADNRYELLENSRNNLGRQVKDLTTALSDARIYSANADSHISEFSVQIAALESINSDLVKTKEKFEENLATSQDEGQNLRAIKTQAEERIALLNRQFDALLNEVGDNAARSRDLSNAPLTERLSVLEDTSNDIISDLIEYRDMSKTVEKTLDGVVAGLSRVAGYTPAAEIEGASRPTQAITLLGKIEAIHDDQLGVVATLLGRTEKAISHKQATLAGTGLDLQKAMQAAGLHTGQGGPLNEMPDFTGGSSADLDGTVAILEQKMLKLQALDKLVACVPLLAPVDYYHVTSKFGKRKDPFTGQKAIHKGVDLGGWPGTAVHATAGGKVMHAGNSNKYGKMVEIDHGCGITTRYGHLKKVLVKKGEEITHRSLIGKLGSTGRSTGPHVHYEIRVDGEPVDPMNFVEAGRYVYKG